VSQSLLLIPKCEFSPCCVDAVNQGVLESWPSKRQKNTLPSLEELAGFLEEPLCDSDKIPITQHFFESLISSPRADKCTPDDIGNLFKIGEPDPDVSCLFAAIFNPAPKGGSKKSFIYFWDSNIRRPLELLIPTGKSIRYSNEHTLTEKLRPDYGFLLKNICSFRGEEKGPEDRGNPKAEMAEKLNWVYDDAPYVFGECPRSECIHFPKYFHRLLLLRNFNDPCRHYCTHGYHKTQTRCLRLIFHRFEVEKESYRQYTPPH